MRTAVILLALAAGVLAPGVGRSGEPKTPAAAITASYPPAARSAGVEGSAVLACDASEHLLLRQCRLVSEDPAGYGFGAAALALAARSRENRKVTLPAGLRTIPVTFKLNPLSIIPDLSQPIHVVTPPSVLRGPSGEQMQLAYPALAPRGLRGYVLLACQVTRFGDVRRCGVEEETPGGVGFAEAALGLIPFYRMKPGLIDGAVVAGARIRLPFEFYRP